MIRFIYNLFWPIGLLFFLPGYLAKMIRRGGYREKFGQRLGIYDRELRVRLSKRESTWLHAVSVGEVNIALKLAHALRALEPDLCCVLTTTTTTGFALANKNAPPWIDVMYTPLDYWPIMRRAFSVIRPTRIVLVEAEVWPNLVALAHERRIPTILVNARLSPRSESRFRRFRFFVAPTFRLLDLVCAQEPEDVDRWAAIGVARDRIRAVGSIKYDPDGRDHGFGSAGKRAPRRLQSCGSREPRVVRRQHPSRGRGNSCQHFSTLTPAISIIEVIHCAAARRTAPGNPRSIRRFANARDAGKRSGDRCVNQTPIALFSIQQVTFIAGMLSPRLCSWGKA